MYELIAGSPPFTEERLRQVGDEAMRREIIETEPPKPSSSLSSSNTLPVIASNRKMESLKLTRAVRGELDWITMRALAKEPKRRYETAGQFSEDIDRYLNNEPVKAVKPSTLYRLSKFVRRNRITVLAGTLVFVALVAGVVGTSLGLKEANRQTEIASNEAKKKNIALQKADTALLAVDKALKAVTWERKKTEAALAAETHQRVQTEKALAEVTEQRRIADVALTNAKFSLVASELTTKEGKLLREHAANVEKQANAYKLQQIELNDKIQTQERSISLLEDNNRDLRDHVARYSTLLQKFTPPDEESASKPR